MSKTIDLQIEKSSTLIEGLRKNMNELQSKGFSNAELDQMENELQALKAANEDCDAFRAQLSAKVKNVNSILDSVKAKYADKKKTIKEAYPQEQWLRYGVIDKR